MTQRINLPKQIEPTVDRAAYAPYNFVPLPERVVAAPPIDAAAQVEKTPDLVRHDRYFSERCTGVIECTLTTETPLFVRCALTTKQFEQAEKQKRDAGETDFRQLVKNTAEFFYTESRETPLIPGSSLRGMLRSLVEIAAYSNLSWVTDRHLFFRTVDPTTIGDIYRDRMVGQVRGGLIESNGLDASIEQCRVYKVPRRLVVANPPYDLYDGNGPNRRPKWGLQHQPVWFKGWARGRGGPTEFGGVDALSFTQPADTKGWQEGILVISGDMQNKKHEFIFERLSNPTHYDVDEAVLERFHDDDQISRWQAQAFPKGQPRARARNGRLPDGTAEPVFFILDDQHQVEFFGRAQMFRLPYLRSPRDLVPAPLRQGPLDIAQSIFGMVPQGRANGPLIAGRVFVSDGTFEAASGALWLAGNAQEAITPRILSGPKPTSFQHYLIQKSDQKRRLVVYDSPSGETAIRGHKRYWHHGRVKRSHIEDTGIGPKDTQHTQFKPVSEGVRFRFTIRFENLSHVELGALLWVLRLSDDSLHNGKQYRLSLGMGKPLGMGAVQVLVAAVKASGRTARYKSLFDEAGEWALDEPALNAGEQQACVDAFCNHVLGQLGHQGPLDKLLRMQCLLALLTWQGITPTAAQYMGLSEYRERRVLPEPTKVLERSALANSPPDTQSAPAVSEAQPPQEVLIGTVMIVNSQQRNAQVQGPDEQLLRPRPIIKAGMALPKIGEQVRVVRQADGGWLIVEISKPS